MAAVFGGLLLLTRAKKKPPTLQVQAATLLAAAAATSATTPGRMTNPRATEAVREIVNEEVRDASERALTSTSFEDGQLSPTDRETINRAYEALAASGTAIIRNI